MRGWNCTQSPYSADRITQPMIRKKGLLVPVSDQHAVKEIATRLAAAGPRESGAGSRVLFAIGPSLANEDVFAAKLLARRLGAPICGTDSSGVAAARWALHRALDRGTAPGSPESLEEADLIWVFGADLENFAQVGSRVTTAARRGAHVVRFDVFPDWRGPGRKSAVTFPPEGAGLLTLLLQKAALDGGRIPPRAESAPGFEALATQLRTGKPPSLPPRDWLPDEKAAELAAAFLEAKRPAAVIGERWLGLDAGGASTRQLLQALALLGGEGNVVFAAGECNSWGAGEVIGEEPGPSPLQGLMDPAGEPGFSALVVFGDDLLRRAPNPAAAAEKIARLETLVVLDRWAGDTARYAHVVLPTCCFGEQDGTLVSAWGTVQRWRQSVKPPKECFPESTWVSRIGRRMGLEEWPVTRKQWLGALQEECAPFKAPDCSSLYLDEGLFGVALGERTAPAFAPPSLPEPAPLPPDFPLRLVFGWHAAAWSTGALSEREDLLRREFPESTLALSPADMKQAGLKPGWPARLATPAGAAVFTAREDARLPEGVALLVPAPGSEGAGLRGWRAGAQGSPGWAQPVPARIEKV